MSTETRNVDTIRAEIARLEGELATLAGDGLTVQRDGVPVRDVPPGGVLLHTYFAGDPGPDIDWYASAEAARARLLKIARGHGCVPSESGWSVDLTPRGVNFRSEAWITRREEEGAA